jgi:carbamate kinase
MNNIDTKLKNIENKIKNTETKIKNINKSNNPIVMSHGNYLKRTLSILEKEKKSLLSKKTNITVKKFENISSINKRHILTNLTSSISI